MDGIQNGSPLDEDTLVDLLKRAQHDADPEAFDGLYLLFADRVFRYLQMHIIDTDAVEEVMARVFVRLVDRINLYIIAPKDNAAIFSAWFYRMAHNLMMDTLRRRKG